MAAAAEQATLLQEEHLFTGAMVVLELVGRQLLDLVPFRAVGAAVQILMEQQVQAARAKSPSQ